MIKEKYIPAISITFIAIASIIVIALLMFGNTDGVSVEASQPEYMTKLFDKDKVSEINIIIDEDKWQEFLDNAMDEEYYICDISINGELFKNVGIRAKGNSSLSMVAGSGSDRYSFKINFGKYVDGQSYYGLDKLALNNNISDATYMKEYLSYEMFSEMGVPTPGYAYSNVKVNGEGWGLYLAVEVMEESFIERYYGSVKGNLYKPESMELGGGKGLDNEGDRGNRINSDFGNMQGRFPNNMQVQTPSNTQEPSTDDSQNNMDMNPPSDAKELLSEMEQTNIKMEPTSSDQGFSAEDRSKDMPMQPPSGVKGFSAYNEQAQLPEVEENKSQEQENNQSQPNGNIPPIPQGDNRGRMPNMFGGGMGRNSNSGTNLVYTDDNISSYSGIFDNAIFEYTTDQDKKNLINIIKNLNKGTDLEKYIDVDEILRYFAVNTFLVNLDSYAGSLKHNYYLYELDNKIQIFPWDLNLSFAGHEMTDGSKAMNFPIDVPVSDTMENSPLISKLLEVDSYKELYHQYLKKQVNEYINSGKYEATISKVNDLIADYVKNDATAFYTYEQYEKSLPMLLQFGKDRADSIIAQLNGQQPTTTYGTLTTTVDLSALGSSGRGIGNRGEARRQAENQGDNGFRDLMANTNNAMGFRSRDNMRQNMDNSNNTDNTKNTDNTNNRDSTKNIDRNFKPNSPDFKGTPSVQNSDIVKTSLLPVVVSILTLVLAYIFVAKFKRRRYRSKDFLK